MKALGRLPAALAAASSSAAGTATAALTAATHAASVPAAAARSRHSGGAGPQRRRWRAVAALAQAMTSARQGLSSVAQAGGGGSVLGEGRVRAQRVRQELDDAEAHHGALRLEADLCRGGAIC